MKYEDANWFQKLCMICGAVFYLCMLFLVAYLIIQWLSVLDLIISWLFTIVTKTIATGIGILFIVFALLGLLYMSEEYN